MTRVPVLGNDGSLRMDGSHVKIGSCSCGKSNETAALTVARDPTRSELATVW
jgi:hypothetical protein